ncbi:MAG: GumC family protein [Kiritimatiellales bacterium]
MRDKPHDDLRFGKPAEEPEKPVLPEEEIPEESAPDEGILPEIPEMPEPEESCPESPDAEGTALSEETAEPEETDPSNDLEPETPKKEDAAPGESGQTSFRIKDQFSDLNTISPLMAHEPIRPSKAPVPGSGLSESARPGRSIRHKITFQDFFRKLDIIKIMRGIYRRFWIALLAAFGLMILLIPAARSLESGSSYSSESVIIYTKPTQKQIDVQGSAFLLRPLSQDTLVDMFLSPKNIQELEEETGFKPLLKNVSFDSQSKSDIVTLQVKDMPSSQAAIDAVNKLAGIIVRNNADYYRQLASAAYDQFKVQREVAEKNYETIVKSVEDFQLKNHLLELNTQYQNYFSSVNAASERFSIAQVAHEGLLVRIKNYEKIIADLPDEVLDESQEDNPLKRRISNAEAALLQARIQYAADNPKILRQEREIEELRKMLQSGNFNETRERTYLKNPLKGEMAGELLKLRSEEKVAAQQVDTLKKELDTLQQRFKELPRLEKEYAALLEKRTQADTALKASQAGEESARLTMESSLSDFKLLSPATEAVSTAASLIGKIIPFVGLVLGFFGGLAVILLIELLDAKIRTQQQLETAYDAPCLASIIEIPHLDDYDHYSLLLPSLREISERLNVVLQGHRTKVLGFFSSQDGEGKSVLSFNLARYYRSLNINVLFVSFDPHPNPCLPGSGEVGWPQMGIEDYLEGRAGLEDMLSTVNGVDIIRVQEPRADLLDLAKGSAMPRLWDLLRQNYDLIITEAPAVLDHPISGTIAGFLDDIIYVLASPVSDRRLVDAGLEFLEDRCMVPRALIFNRVDPYYLEDVRQQRIIRNLSERRNPLVDFVTGLQAHFMKLMEKSPSSQPMAEAEEQAISPEEDLSPKDEIPEVEPFDDEDELPELIGEEEGSEPSPETTEDKENEELPEQIEEEAEPTGEKDLSFRDWLGDTEEDSDDHEK